MNLRTLKKANDALKAINVASIADPIMQDDIDAAVLAARSAGVPRGVVETYIRQTKITVEQCQAACDAVYNS